MQAIKIEELEAARRITDLAIKLHFSQGDPVGVHTLTVTAYRILRRHGQEKNLPDIVPEYLDLIHQTNRHLFWTSLSCLDPVSLKTPNSSQSPFWELAIEITDLLLFICCALYRMLDNQHTHEMRIFIIWYKAISPLKHEHDPIFNAKTRDGFDYLNSLSREKQLTMGYDALRNLKKPEGQHSGTVRL